MENFQDLGHPQDHDYEKGSPHLLHSGIRSRIHASLRRAVTSIIEAKGDCRVLEVGAGHGDFTDTLVGAGATVVVTEMSEPSAMMLSERYRHNPHVSVIFDPEGLWLQETEEVFDLIACISVLHHIPDYMSFLELAFKHTLPGGIFISWQDPLWYPRRSRRNLMADRLAYMAWRITQGEISRGVRTRIRHLRGVLDETNPSDMVEYHVVREGVDEHAIQDLGDRFFESTAVITYWSTQNRPLQRLGEQIQISSTFGLVFMERKGVR